MRKNGFTLIELLAVIVILAIIALITVPIVINIIDDSKKSSQKESIKLYLDHAQKMIAKEQMKDPTFKPSECKIKSEGNLLCETKEIQIEMKGQKPKSGKIKFLKGMIIEGKNIELDNLYYQVKNDNISEGMNEKVISYSEYIKLEKDADNDGKVSPGDEYTYEVMDNMKKPYTFYVLSIEGDKVNLIMDRNICGTNDDNNGKEATKANKCLIAWYASSNYNSNGPVTAMQGIYNATKNWINVPNMNLEGDNAYQDESGSAFGYGTIETTELGIKITKYGGRVEVTREDNQTPVIPYETNKPLKARLPKLSEVYNTDDNDTLHCHRSYSSCPTWLTNGLDQYSAYYQDNEHIEGIYGYWTLSSDNNYAACNARGVFYDGLVHYTDTSWTSVYGIRAVITVSMSDLS